MSCLASMACCLTPCCEPPACAEASCHGARQRAPAKQCRPLALSAAAAVGAGIPAEFVMKNTTKFADPMLAFADKGGELGEWEGALLPGEVCCSSCPGC